MHKGGIADKIGSRYEARWLTYQLLGLLDGSARSITVEALGKEGQGFEFSIERAGGIEWHQCKRQTATGAWSIANLDAAGVLAAFLCKSVVNHRCLFVSSDPSSQLKSLQDKLPATHTPEGFEASLSNRETQYWSLLKQRLGSDSAGAFDFLGRTEFRTLSEADLTGIVRAQLSYWFRGKPDAIASRLRTWLEEERNFNRPLTNDDLIGFISEAGIETKQYELDRALPGRVRDSTISYVRSYPAVGAGLFHIERSEVQSVLAGLQAGAGVILLAGAAGVGKSTILAEVTKALRAIGTLHLAFRVDQIGIVATLDELGTRIIGTADNPVVILEQLAVSGSAVLIIDQADAVSKVSGRIPELRRVILDLIHKAVQYPHVQLIFSCRSFDLENDHAFREIAETEGNIRIDVKPFERSEVESILTGLGILYNGDNIRLMSLLSLPIGLSLAADLSRSGVNDLRSVEQISELYRQLLDVRDREIRRDFNPGWSIFAPLTALADGMSERQELVAPALVMDSFGGAVDILQRVGLIVTRGPRVGLLHESLFDYLYARAFVQKRHPLVDFLIEGEQSLFRRTQARQILAFERELQSSRYITDLGAILSDGRVRPHVRETIVRWLATVPEPTPAEWRLVEQYAARAGLPMKAGYVIHGRKPWFDLLQRLGVIETWLLSNGSDLQWALHFLCSIASLAPGEVARLFDSLLERRPDQVRAVFGALRWFDPKEGAEPLANSLIAALERSIPEDWESEQSNWYDYYAPWIKTAPRHAARIFGVQLRRWFHLNPEGHPFKRRYEEGGTALHWLADLAKAAPLPFLEEILPFMRLAMERSAEDDRCPARDTTWCWRPWNQTDVRSFDLLDVVRRALATGGRDDPEAIARVLRAIEPERFITSLHLLLEAIPANPAALYPLLIEQLDNPGLFRAGWHHADGHSAACAIAAALPHLEPRDRARCEAAIVAMRPELDSASRALARDRAAAEEPVEGMPGTALPSGAWSNQYTRWWLQDSGKREWSVLRQIGAEKLSPRAADRLAELERKFAGQQPEQPAGIRGGWIRSPIATEQTKLMDDEAWLGAIAKFSVPRERRQWGEDGLCGGAMELSRELKERAKEAPKRFLALLARLPEGSHGDFAWGIVAAFAEIEPSAEMVERVLATVLAHPTAWPDDRALIWLIRACSAPVGPLAEAALLRMAVSSDDSTGVGDRDRGERAKEPDWKLALERGGELGIKAINSARGLALKILGDVCWKSHEAFAKYRPLIDTIIGSPAAAHIHAALNGMLLSALKHEGGGAIEWVLRTARACPDALFARNGEQVVNWIGDLDTEGFTELIEIYLFNADPLARAFAAMAIFNRCLHDFTRLPVADKLIDASAEYRSAAAAVAAANFQSARSGTLCTTWLLRFFGDEEKFVRQEASDCFRRLDATNIAEHSGLFEAYAASRYFETDRTYFVHSLENAPPELDGLVLKLLEEAVTASEEQPGNSRAYELHQMGELALRLYASNVEQPDLKTRALDLIDRLVERGLMDIQKLEAA